MGRKYKWRKQDDWSADIGLSRLMTNAGLKIVAGKGPFTLTQDGDPIGGTVSRAVILDRLRQAVSNREIGSTFRVRDGNGTVKFTCRAVLAYSDADTTNGNARADTLWNWIRTQHRNYEPRYAGAYVCKLVSGSTSRSQHSYGNAVDVFFDTLDHQDAVATAIVQNEDAFRPYHVISRSRIYTKGQGWHSFGGDFHAHLHVDFDPQYSGECGLKG